MHLGLLHQANPLPPEPDWSTAVILMLCSLLVALSLALTFENTIGINIERHLNLGYTTRCRWNSIQSEVPERLVLPGHGSFALQDVDIHRGLTVRPRVLKDFSLLFVGIVVFR